MTDVVEPGTDVVPAGEHGGVVAFEDEEPVVVEGHHHPGPRQYVIIAIILVILTGIEVAVSYLEGTSTRTCSSSSWRRWRRRSSSWCARGTCT